MKSKKIPHCRKYSKIKYQNRIKTKSIPLTHKYTIVHLPGLIQAPQ